MAFTAPAPPDALIRLLKGQVTTPDRGVAPLPTGQGTGVPLSSGIGTPALPATAMGVPVAAAAAANQQAKAPAPSDDPAVSGGSGIPKVPDFSEYIRQGIARRQAAEDKLNALHVPTPEENKPSLWRKILGAPFAVAAGMGNPQAGAQATENILHGKFNRATAQYNAEAAPLKQQLEESKEDMPLYTAAGEAANRQFEAGIGAHREARETQSAENKVAYQTQLNDIRKMYDEGRIEDAQKAIDERLKALAEKKEHDQSEIDLRQQLVGLKSQLADKGKDKSSQFRTVATQKANAISKANAKYEQMLSGLAPNNVSDQRSALGEYIRDLQDAQDAYEEGITTLGGTAEHQEVTLSGGSPSWEKSSVQPEASGQAGPAASSPQPVPAPVLKAPAGVPQDELNAYIKENPAAKLPDGHEMKYHGKSIAVVKNHQWVAK